MSWGAVPTQQPATMRIGYFPNMTHAQALVGRANGRFEQVIGKAAGVEWKAFNAGPQAIEALFVNAIDIAYVGPNPTVAGYSRSRGAALRVIAGATSGGAALVVRTAAGIGQPSDFHGKRVATPQLGGTQDVALRGWLAAHNMRPREKGGDVLIFPTANPNQLTLFLSGQLDAAWAPEPWASILVHQGGGRIFLDERDLWPNREFITTNVIVSTRFLKEHPDLVKLFLRAHVELTGWLLQNPAQAKQILNSQIQKETGRAMPASVLEDGFARMKPTYDPLRSSLMKSTEEAFAEGFLGRTKPDLEGLYDLGPLNEVLRESKARPVQ